MKMKRAGSTTHDTSTPSATKTSKTDDRAAAIKTPKVRSISNRCNHIGGVYHADTADVNFVFDVGRVEEVVPVHKYILAAQSPVFRQMFYESELKETGDIKLPDTTIDAFVRFMKFLYGRQYLLIYNKLKISELVYLAHKYDVNWLEEECQSLLSLFIHRNFQTVFWVLPLADLYNFDVLQRKCIEKMEMHGNQIINSYEFVHSKRSVVEKILSTDFVDRNEVKMFEKCIDWAKCTCRNAKLNPESPGILRAQLGDCFNLIRFESMTLQQFVKCLSVNAKVFTSDEIQAFSSKMSETNDGKDTLKSHYVDSARDIFVRKEMKSDGNLLRSLFQDQTTADVTLIFKDAENKVTKRFPAHKCILASKSGSFADQIKDLTKPNQEIHIADAWSSTFEAFLELIYTFEWEQCVSFMENIPDQNVDAVLSLAKEYRVLDIICDYEYYFCRKVNIQNVMWCFDLAHKYSMGWTKRHCVEFLEKIFIGEKPIESEAFLEIGHQNLKVVLKLRAWNNGKPVVDACIKWAKKYCEKNQLDPAKPENLRVAFGDALELIPFSAMDLTEFAVFQSHYKDMLTTVEIAHVMDDIVDRIDASSSSLEMSCAETS